MAALNSLVSEAVDIVVHSARTEHGVQVTEVVAVEEQSTGPGATQFTVSELFRRTRRDQPLRWTGNLPVRAGRALADAGYDVRTLLDESARARP